MHIQQLFATTQTATATDIRHRLFALRKVWV